VVQTLPSPLPPIPLAVVVGNDHLDPEDMTAFELGYRSTLFKKVGLNLELYYNDIDKVIENVILRKTLPLLISWENDFHVIAKGFEVSADYPVTPWWSLTANYTFQEVEYKRVNQDVPGTPKHKFNLWSSFRFKNGFSLDLIAHYVDETKWSGLTGDVKVDDYWRYDIRIAQKLFNDKLEVSFTGQNLTDKLHPETSDGTGTYEVERLLYGQITFRF
jgi:outer membrane receptor protein involved in Fe transport